MESPGKYRIEERARGFSIYADDRVSTHVSRTKFGFRIYFGDQLKQLLLFEELEPSVPIGTDRGKQQFVNLVRYRPLTEFVAAGLMSEQRHLYDRQSGFDIGDWAVARTRYALAKRIHEQWLRLREGAAPRILRVQKAVFAATFSDHELLCLPEFYRSDRLVSDVLKYRAAASAVLLVSQVLAIRQQLPDTESISAAEQIEGLQEWMSLYSSTGTTYRSLTRTLMNLPGGVPVMLLGALNEFKLERPLTDRVELLTLLLSRRLLQQDPLENRFDRSKIFMHASRNQIKAALELVSRHLAEQLSSRRTGHLSRLVQMLVDYPDPHHGNIVGLARKSIRWHEDYRRRELAETLSPHTLATATEPPPIPVPSIPGMKFLATVGDILLEGDAMRHCIASYVDSAVNGNSYLFHFQHKDDVASIEVDRDGNVRQAQGPRNSKNNATRVAYRVLHEWGKNFPQGNSRRKSDRFHLGERGHDDQPVYPF